MAKKYIVTKDMVKDAPSSTEEQVPFSTKGAYTELAKKLDIAATSADVNKIPVVKETSSGSGVYKLKLETITQGTQADWSEATETATSFIKNKPFKTVGSGCTVDADGKLNVDTQLHFEVFTDLPTPTADNYATYKQTIALVKIGETENYKEYVPVKLTDTPLTWKWNPVGDLTTQVDQSATEIKIAGVTINSATAERIGLLTKENFATFNGKQDALTFDDAPTASSTNPVKSGGVYTALEDKQTAALVTVFQATPDDVHYPSEKLVKDNIDTLTTSIGGKIPYAASGLSFKIGSDANGYYIEE